MTTLHAFEREAALLEEQWRSGDAARQSAALDGLEEMARVTPPRALALLADLARRIDIDQRVALAEQLALRWEISEERD